MCFMCQLIRSPCPSSYVLTRLSRIGKEATCMIPRTQPGRRCVMNHVSLSGDGLLGSWRCPEGRAQFVLLQAQWLGPPKHTCRTRACRGGPGQCCQCMVLTACMARRVVVQHRVCSKSLDSSIATACLPLMFSRTSRRGNRRKLPMRARTLLDKIVQARGDDLDGGGAGRPDDQNSR